MKAVILAGGKGTRMGALTRDIPKPMIPLNGKPLLEYQIEWCRREGIAEVYLIINHLGASIEAHFGDGSPWNIAIKYYREAKPLGTTGGVKELEEELQEDFLVLYGDVLFDVDLPRLVAFHKAKQSEGTLVVHPNDHPYDSDLVETDAEQRIIAVHPKPHTKNFKYHNRVNAALYLFTPAIFEHLPKGQKRDFGRDIFPKVYQELKLYAYNTPEYLKDMGTPDRLQKVEAQLSSGYVQRRSLKERQMALFLDRDGVLNYDTDLISNPEEFDLYPGTIEAIRQINQSEYLAVVATNQSVVARNRTTIEGLGEIHKKMETMLGNEGAYLDAIHFCPHHPHKGYLGENPKYKIDCHCRKPKPGMLTDAAENFNIDLSASYMIGDSERDIMAGKNAGCTTIGVMTGHGQRQSKVEPDFFMANLPDAVDFILNNPYAQDLEQVLSFARSATEKPTVISVAGNSRSGKSTFAKSLQLALEKEGRKVLYVKLDDWILPREKRRKNEEVLHNFQIEKLEGDVKRIMGGEAVALKPYAALPGKAIAQKEYGLKDHTVVILEGVVALATDYLRASAHYKVFMEINTEEHWRRFKDFYEWKGYEAKTLQSLYEKRSAGEYREVAGHKKYANHCISTGS